MTLGAPALIQRSPALRAVIRAVARLLNPLVLMVAGRRWMPILGVVHHRGRRTGRIFATPLGMRSLGSGAVVVPRTFGQGAGWYRNLLAAGWVDATYAGVTFRVGQPQVRGLRGVAAAFPAYERALFRLLGIDDFTILKREVQ